MTGPAPRCGRLNYWFDVDLTTSCRRPTHHDGDHCDGLRWYDHQGFQKPGDDGERLNLSPRNDPDDGRLGPRPRDKRCDACGRERIGNLGSHRRFCAQYRMAGAA